MKDLLMRFIAAPTFDNETDALRGRVLNVMLLTVFLVAPIVMIGNLFEPEPSGYVFGVGLFGLGIAVVIRWLLFNGRMYMASVLWVLLFSALVTVNAIVLGTVRSTNTSLFLINIVVAGWLLDQRAVLAVTAYNSLVVLIIILAQWAGWLAPSPFVSEAFGSLWFNYTALFVGMAMLMLVSIQVLNQSISQARGEKAMLMQRDAILEAAAYTAQQLLESSDWRDNIQKVLERLGTVVGATHAYIFERHITPGGYFALSQRFEWVRPRYPSEIDNPEYQNISLSKIETQAWYLELSRGQVMTANLRTCPLDLAEYFSLRDIQSILEIPIMVSGQWWGVLGFDDFAQSRDWSAQEIETIEIAASTLGLAIQRQRSEQSLRQRESIMEAAAYAAKTFLESSDWRDVIQGVLARLGEATESSHVYLFENHLMPDGREGTSQRYEWVAPGCQPDLDDPMFQNMLIKEEHTETWLASMTAGEVYYCNLDQVPERDHHLYLERKLLTYLDAPIYINGVWWGILGLDDNYRVRDWAAVELDAIKVVASTLGSAIQRQLRDEAFRKAEREHRAELEQRVQERTRQLQDALQEIEGVSFTASHDLRAPLRAVDGYASIMINEYGDSLNGEQVGYLQKIKQASQRMARLLDDLIRLIRYSRQPIRRQEVDLSELAQRALRALRERDSARKAQVNIAPGLMVFGDRALLDVVINELLGNAWKFTENQPTAEIQFGSTQQDGLTVFFLKDNGIGFDMAYANKLFRNFEQLHQPGMVEGTGMGLATVHRIIQRHGGRIWADGQLNGGATFYFTLPDSG